MRRRQTNKLTNEERIGELSIDEPSVSVYSDEEGEIGENMAGDMAPSAPFEDTENIAGELQASAPFEDQINKTPHPATETSDATTNKTPHPATETSDATTNKTPRTTKTYDDIKEKVPKGSHSIAIGQDAGMCRKGSYSVAIGAFAATHDQEDNSIVINATGEPLNTTCGPTTYIGPILSSRGVSSKNELYNLKYDVVSKASYYDPSSTSTAIKTFVIDHPTIESNYLIHACLEGPEAGVYYRGCDKIKANGIVQVLLPPYAIEIAKADTFTVQLTPISTAQILISCSKVQNDGTFTVYGPENVEFFWHVTGCREEIDVEVKKSKLIVRGDGPYTYAMPNKIFV